MYWDYRLCNDTNATFQCIVDFFEELGSYNNDIGEWGLATALLNNFDIKNPFYWTYWDKVKQIRRIVDKLNMPYDVFWREAFKQIRGTSVKFLNPTVFLNDWVLKKSLTDALKSGKFFFAKHEYFSVAEYKNLPLQNEYYQAMYDTYTGDMDTLKRLLESGKISKQFFVNLKNDNLDREV